MSDPRDRVVQAARELVRQIANNDFVDSLGHQALYLRAYSELQHALGALPADMTSGDELTERYARALSRIALMNGRSTEKSAIAAEALNWFKVSPLPAPPTPKPEGE